MTASGIEVVKRVVPKAKLQVGAKSDVTAFPPGEKVFHSSSVPADKRAAKMDMKKAARGDRIGQKQPNWDISVEDPVKLCVRRVRQIPDVSSFQHACSFDPRRSSRFISLLLAA